jgi:AcrR family transcriptional regulator
VKSTILKPRRRARISRAKVAERREQVLEGLLTAAGALLAERGLAQVSVEQILLAAGISRGTFYGYFGSKAELAAAILKPVFEEGTEALEALVDRPPATIVPGIVDLYLDLWERRREALLMIPGVDADTFGRIREAHLAFTESLYLALEKAAGAGQLRNGSASYSLKVLTRTAVPLLRVYQDHPDQAQLYRESLLALLRP